MIRFIVSLFLLVTITTGANAAVLVMSQDGTYRAKASLAAANTALDAAGKTIVVTSPQVLTGNLTLSTTRVWRFVKGATVNTAGFTLNVNGAPFEAGDHQVFTGTGTVTGLSITKPQWFGNNAVPGTTDMTAAVQAAAGAGYHLRLTQLYKTTAPLDPTGLTEISGDSYKNTGLDYYGTGSGILTVNPVNTSGYGNLKMHNFRVKGYGGTGNTGAGIAIQAGGKAYYDIDHVWITGNFKYGVVFDQAIVSGIQNSIIESGTGIANSGGVWIVNGAEWTTGANKYWTNRIYIKDNQINAAATGIIDDGGTGHVITGNNINGNSNPVRIADTYGLIFEGNTMENQLTTGTANLLMTDTSGVGGAVKGTNRGFSIKGNIFAAGTAAGGKFIKFESSGTTAADYHYGGTSINGNWFGNKTGIAALIDVIKLANSEVGPNDDSGTGSMYYYTGVHNDAYGNILHPPKTGSLTIGQGTYEFGRTDKIVEFHGGLDALGGLYLNDKKWQTFTVIIYNDAGTLKHQIVDGPYNTTNDPGQADKITGASKTLTATPTVDTVTDFAAGVGISGGAIYFNTASQGTNAPLIGGALVEYYSGGVVLPCATLKITTTNINGSNIARLGVRLSHSTSGADWTINTTNIPAGKYVAVKVSAWVR